jgi:hypothetical protein
VINGRDKVERPESPPQRIQALAERMTGSGRVVRPENFEKLGPGDAPICVMT